jgi:hypothetical protein
MLQIVELPSSPSETRPSEAEVPANGLSKMADISVIYTTADETLAALRAADELARPLKRLVRLIDFRVVQVGAPVDAPTGRSPLETNGLLDRVRSQGIDVQVEVYVCRDVRCAIPRVFTGHSLIVLGGRHHWWPTRTERLRQILDRRGHFVLLVDGATPHQ